MGASDVVYAMVTGETWLRVPETVVVETCGAPGRFTTAKDLMLHLMAEYGEAPFLYRSIEWTGDWIDGLSMDSAATIANMTVELGAKCAFLPPRPGAPAGLRPTGPAADKQIRVDLASVTPYIARPHSPLSGQPIDTCRGQPIDYVFVGSCANSRLEDIAEVARVLDGRYVHSRVHMIVTPGSQRVYLQALERGYVDTLVRAGALVTPAGCGACVGTQGTIPATGSRVLSTMNRNFRGRMGNPNADIWLSSPVVAATAAVRGEIPGMKDLR
jgi:3-isopropylmalate/(R)-2-methylmalate dehydratase large subunit